MNNQKIQYSLPGLWERWPLVLSILIAYNQHPEFFYSNIRIANVYGNFYPCIWDGGRPEKNDQLITYASYEDINIISYIYNNIFNIPMKFIFTNSILENRHLKDEFCNYILKQCANNFNIITINSKLLENYILENYQNQYHFISSITKVLNKEEFLKELENPLYIEVCLPLAYNKDINFLKTIPLELQKKIEILVNSNCYMNCPVQKKHYQWESLANLNYDISMPFTLCPINKKNYLQDKNPTLSLDDISLYHQNYNINFFKINGRLICSVYDYFNSVLKYLIKQEAQVITLKYIIFIYQEIIEKYDFNLKNIVNIIEKIKK